MEITRNVILDLLPMYLANEVSTDTRELINNYLETDREMKNIVKHSGEMGLPGDIPVPLTHDDNMKAFRKAKRNILLGVLILAIGPLSVIAVILYNFLVSSG